MKDLLKIIEAKSFSFNIKNITLFAFVWFTIGFSLGTATLMGPVRWITDYTRISNMESSIENWAVRVTIFIFVIFSFKLSLYLVREFLVSNSAVKKILIVVIPLIVTFFSLWLWLNPKMMQFNSVQTSESYGNIEFIFGPYPEEDKIIELKNQNIRGIISLLHEAVVPFEPKLLGDERELAIKHGVELIHLPMLPWVSANENSMKEVRKLAKEGSGKYYVHCYLGKDRVGVVRRAIKEILGEEKISGEVNTRKIDDFEKFERGEIVKLDSGLYVTPYPTDEEFFAFVLNGSFKNVVSLLTPENIDDRQWIDKEEKILKENGINYTLLPINLKFFDPLKLYDHVKTVRSLEKPVLVHAFLSPSPQSKVFIDCYISDTPALPEYIFSRFMQGGKVKLIKPNIAIGPQPLEHEINGYLFERGIRTIGYSGKENKEISELKNAAENGNIKWVNISNNNIHLTTNGGPWYLFGDNIDKMIKSDY